MPGEIDEESIIENKPAIKNYWETKMRENAASQFARSNFGVPPTTIIDKINDEIREDYLRNLELMQDEGLPRSSSSDISDEVIEFDSFDLASSNGSSPFGKPLQTSSPLLMPESPTLIDSGHQSQESHHPVSDTDVLDSQSNASVEVRDSSASPQPTESVTAAVRRSVSPSAPKPALNGYGYRAPVERQRIKSTGKIENHVTHYLQFNKLFSKTVKPLDEPQALEKNAPRPFKNAAVPVVSGLGSSKVDDEKPVVKTVPVQESTVPLLKNSSKNDEISYLLATSRLKKEIEDNLKREQELKEEGRVRTLSVDTVVESPETRRVVRRTSIEPVLVVALEAKEPDSGKGEQHLQNQKQGAVIADTKPKVRRSFSTPGQKPLIEEVPPISQEDPVESPHGLGDQQKAAALQNGNIDNVQPLAPSMSFKLGKNFNSLERYIMYSSLTKLNYRSMPPLWTKSASQEVLNEEPVEVKDDETDEEPEKARKYYVPAERKIQEELQEMMEREAELKKSRGMWKSTPNLSAVEESEPVEEEPVVLRQPVGRRNTEKRRRSALISKWEDMISKHNQN